MIFENKNEKEAFEFVCSLASQATDRICTDLEKEDYEKFKHLKVICFDQSTKTKEMVEATQTYDIIHWLMRQVKGETSQ